MSFKLTNNSRHISKHGHTNWWEWVAYIETSPPSSLNEIEYVEYHLHPTFKNPVVRVRKSNGGFPLKRKGWGVFKLRAKIIFKDKQKKPLLLEHDLTFGN